MKYSEIVSEINIRIAKSKMSNSLNSFFIGLTNYIEDDTLTKHQINKNDWFLQLPADSLEIDEDVVCYFGMMGMNTRHAEIVYQAVERMWVYCYKITMHSVE